MLFFQGNKINSVSQSWTNPLRVTQHNAKNSNWSRIPLDFKGVVSASDWPTRGPSSESWVPLHGLPPSGGAIGVAAVTLVIGPQDPITTGRQPCNDRREYCAAIQIQMHSPLCTPHMLTLTPSLP